MKILGREMHRAITNQMTTKKHNQYLCVYNQEHLWCQKN